MQFRTIEMEDGTSIHACLIMPSIRPIGHIHILHGMSEHIGRYEEFMSFLAAQGYVVSGHDHRGHGKTASLNGFLGHFGDDVTFDRIVQDAQEVISLFRSEVPAENFILFGHSMGSFIARRYVQLHQDIDQLILSGTGDDPGIGGTAGIGLAQISCRLGRFNTRDPLLNKLVFGAFSKSVPQAKTPFDWLSTNPESVREYINDPLCGAVPTTKFFLELFTGLKKANNIKLHKTINEHLPILFLSGSEDPVGRKGKGVWEAARQYEKVGIKQITVMLYDGGRHEMLQEQNRQEVFHFIVDWIEGK
ncbi:alpha/beta hydrolase [Sporosarcina sp. NCCP-2222]|uniref:alpha/beta hydrolase n=1 Tax=Sporosarcina sp. NCCP-2222 TaxID=2935073 RepID=UPI00207F39AA|nr:alpha/beta hydrolase [Sporosarcina sp. NCCP-2222]GKV55511.1 alpha/beta hydrolase [Sporosarcina sp. NCCP-2222]